MLIREATTGDGLGIAKVKIKTWRTAYKDIFPSDKLAEMDINENAERWEKNIQENLLDPLKKILVAEKNNGEIIGFAGGWKCEKEKYDCEVSAIYVLEEHQRKGLGTQMMCRLIEFFKQHHWKSMIIWVLEKNVKACNFYAKLGGKPKERQLYEKWENVYTLIGYVWKNINTMIISTDFDC